MHTPAVRASMIQFLNKVEFATQKEIGVHLREDDSLPLSPNERVRVGYSTLKSPVFIGFYTANLVGEKELQTEIEVVEKQSRLC